MMRYYNENPQMTVLLEKIEEQDRQIKFCKEECAISQQEIKRAEEMYKRCLLFTGKFNKMPWYKKMFFKFKL